MTSTAPTRPARNRQVSSRIANDNNSVSLSAAAQKLLSAKPIIDLVKKIAKLTLFLPETVPLATEEDAIPRRIFELEGEDGTVASTFSSLIQTSTWAQRDSSDEPSAPKTRAAAVIGVVLYAELAIVRNVNCQN
ncbi:hypothetical protein FB451DRAFT_1367336 [Mycena latifolia]|nr:hypothetical protein FB451DRAFT_1367336 [Mycena latifolia]